MIIIIIVIIIFIIIIIIIISSSSSSSSSGSSSSSSMNITISLGTPTSPRGDPADATSPAGERIRNAPYVLLRTPLHYPFLHIATPDILPSSLSLSLSIPPPPVSPLPIVMSTT